MARCKRPSLKNVPLTHRLMVEHERYERDWFRRPIPGVATAVGEKTTARAEVIRVTK